MILLLGSSGLLGGQVLRKSLEKKYPTRIVLRGSSDWKDASMTDLKRRDVEMAIADVTDLKAVKRAFEGATAVINIVGIMDPLRLDEMEKLHVQGTQNLITVALEKGVQRFIHVGCLGARAESDSVYLRTKFASEELVRDANFYWTVFRPSYMFSDSYFPFMDLLLPLITFRPILPILGAGVNPVQPVWVENVADCIVESIYNKETVSKTFDLAGPQTYSMSELMELVRTELGMGGHSLNISTPNLQKLSSWLNRFPKSPLSKEAMHLVMSTSFTEKNALGEGSIFNTEPTSLEELLPKILDAYCS
jgi:uncharacterized protein YbjT (DUF2867 family)